jgi:hypothetical protein
MKPALDPGSPAQASLLTWRLPLSRSPADLPDCASRRFAGLFNLPDPIETVASIKTTRCSAALLGAISTASRFAHQSSEKPREPRRATGRLPLPAPLPGWPRQEPKLSSIACRRRSDLWSPAAPFRVVADPSEEAGTAVPITKAPCTSDSSRGSEIFGIKPVDNVDIGNNVWNLSGFRASVAVSFP